MNFDEKIAGTQYIYTAEYSTPLDGNKSIKKGDILTLSGWKNGQAYYTVEYPEWPITLSSTLTYYSSAQKVSRETAQKVVDGVINNNKIIFENNLFCARFSSRLTPEEMDVLYNLQKRLEERETKLREADLFSAMEEAKIKGYSNLQPYLQDFMTKYESGQIGLVISTTVAIIVVAIVLASVATAAYYAYKSSYTESLQDVKWSNQLTKTLTERLSEEEFNQLKKETAGIVTKTKIYSSLGTSKKIIGWIMSFAAVGLGLYIWRNQND